MQIGRPSRTALGAAMHRAVHQTLEGGVVFADPYALQILDDEARAGLPTMADDPAHRPCGCSSPPAAVSPRKP